jgi:hypothetical protein
VFNSSGVLIDSIAEVSSDSVHSVKIKDLFILNNMLFTLVTSCGGTDTTSTVKVMDFKGNVKNSWQVKDAQSIEPVSSSGMAIQRKRSIDYYDLTGTFKTSISMKWNDWSGNNKTCGDAFYFCIDTKGRSILVKDFDFMVFNTSGTMISKYDLYITKYWQAGGGQEPLLYCASDFNSKKDIVYLSIGNKLVKIINNIQ